MDKCPGFYRVFGQDLGFMGRTALLGKAMSIVRNATIRRNGLSEQVDINVEKGAEIGAENAIVEVESDERKACLALLHWGYFFILGREYAFETAQA